MLELASNRTNSFSQPYLLLWQQVVWICSITITIFDQYFMQDASGMILRYNLMKLRDPKLITKLIS